MPVKPAIALWFTCFSAKSIGEVRDHEGQGAELQAHAHLVLCQHCQLSLDAMLLRKDRMAHLDVFASFLRCLSYVQLVLTAEQPE